MKLLLFKLPDQRMVLREILQRTHNIQSQDEMNSWAPPTFLALSATCLAHSPLSLKVYRALTLLTSIWPSALPCPGCFLMLGVASQNIPTQWVTRNKKAERGSERGLPNQKVDSPRGNAFSLLRLRSPMLIAVARWCRHPRHVSGEPLPVSEHHAA